MAPPALRSIRETPIRAHSRVFSAVATNVSRLLVAPTVTAAAAAAFAAAAVGDGLCAEGFTAKVEIIEGDADHVRIVMGATSINKGAGRELRALAASHFGKVVSEAYAKRGVGAALGASSGRAQCVRTGHAVV